MKRFHYHHWLAELGEMEMFYRELGYVCYSSADRGGNIA